MCGLIGALPVGCPTSDATDPTSGLASGGGRIELDSNPSRAPIFIAYQAPETRPASSLEIFDAAGRLVIAWPLDGRLVEGRLRWGGSDGHGRPVPAGIYLVYLRSGHGQGIAQRLILLR